MDLVPAYKIGLNPNAKEFVFASSRPSGGGSDFVIFMIWDLIPMCGFNGFFGDANCEWGVEDVLNHVGLNKGHKFLHMEEPPRPVSPRSPKAWAVYDGNGE